jgi:hypothetical protein
MADGESSRLGLIDRPNFQQIAALRKDRDVSTNYLLEIGKILKNIGSRVQILEAELKGAASLEGQLAELQKGRPRLSDELEVSRDEFLKRQAVSAILNETLSARNAAAEHLLNTSKSVESLSSVAKRLAETSQLGVETVVSLVQKMVEVLGSVRETGLEMQASALDEEIERLFENYKKQDEAHQRLQSRQNEFNDSLRREDHLRRQIEHMSRQREELTNLKS